MFSFILLKEKSQGIFKKKAKMPSATKTLFEKRVLDSQKLLIISMRG